MTRSTDLPNGLSSGNTTRVETVLTALGLSGDRSRKASSGGPPPVIETDAVADLFMDLTEDEIEAVVTRICTRDLRGVSCPYLHIDASPVASVGERGGYLVRATALTACADLEPIGLAVIDADEPSSWGLFMLSLRARGLANVEAVGIPAVEGLPDVVATVFPDARCERAGPLVSLDVRDPHSPKGDVG